MRRQKDFRHTLILAIPDGEDSDRRPDPKPGDVGGAHVMKTRHLKTSLANFGDGELM